jgi:hypothetical protein
MNFSHMYFLRYGLKRLMSILPILLLFAACTRSSETSNVTLAGGRVGQFKGVVAIQEVIRTRILSSGSASFNLGPYLAHEDSLISLLGGYSDVGLRNDFRNGTPNSLNMFLWNITMSMLASDIARSCGTIRLAVMRSQVFDYNDSFAKHLNALCSWPNSQAKNETNLRNLWIAVQGFDAPKEEFEAWRDFFLSPQSPYADKPNEESMAAMLKTMFLSPYFLLEH